MNNENKKLLEMLNSSAMKLTREEIELILEEEMEKDPGEADEILIDNCIAALAKLDDAELVDEGGQKTYVFNFAKLFTIIAAVAVLVCMTVSTASTKEGYYDIKSDNVRLEAGQYVLDLSEESKVVYPTQSVKELEELGLEGVVLPKVLLTDEYEINKVELYNSEKESLDCVVYFKSLFKYNVVDSYINIANLVEDNTNVRISFKDSYTKAKQISVENMNVYIFGNDNDSTIIYSANSVIYHMTLTGCDFDSAVKIAETI